MRQGTYYASQARAGIACEQQKSAVSSCSHGVGALLVTESLPEQRTLRALQVSHVLAYLWLVGESDIPVGRPHQRPTAEFWFGNDGSAGLVGKRIECRQNTHNGGVSVTAWTESYSGPPPLNPSRHVGPETPQDDRTKMNVFGLDRSAFSTGLSGLAA